MIVYWDTWMLLLEIENKVNCVIMLLIKNIVKKKELNFKQFLIPHMIFLVLIMSYMEVLISLLETSTNLITRVMLKYFKYMVEILKMLWTVILHGKYLLLQHQLKNLKQQPIGMDLLLLAQNPINYFIMQQLVVVIQEILLLNMVGSDQVILYW